jgi:hypothetical protein
MSSPVFSEQIIYQPARAPEEPGTAYAGFKPSSIVLPKGHQKTSECRALPIDLIWDRDVMLPMRDGVRIAADIFRPADATTPLPALMAWSPYGKTGAGNSSPYEDFGPYLNLSGVISLDIIPHRAGVPINKSLFTLLDLFLSTWGYCAPWYGVDGSSTHPDSYLTNHLFNLVFY